MKFERPGFRDTVEAAPPLRPQLNVAPIFDVITGDWADGENKEKILNGGILNFVGVIGEGNTFKSTIADSIIARILSHHPSATFMKYDTEGSVQVSRFANLAKQHESLQDEDFYANDSRYLLTTSSDVTGDVWFSGVRKKAEELIKDKKMLGTTPFIDRSVRDKVSLVQTRYPSIVFIDSLSEFRTAAAQEKMIKSDIDDKEQNDYYMRANLEKSRMITEIPQFAGRAGVYFMTTAHVDDTINMSGKPERKNLTYMRQGQDIKRVPKNFKFLTNHCWEIIKSAPFYNSDRTGPYYPSKSNESANGKTDLMLVTFHGLRNKTGLSGIPLDLVISQASGILWGLSHWHFLNSRDDQGLVRKGANYTLDFYPDVSIMRTTVRDLLMEDKRLARAVELQAEIYLMYNFKDEIGNKYRMSASDIREKVISQGYDWEKILDSRGYWLFKEEEDMLQPPPYLSGYDLLRMAVGEYNPIHFKK